MSLIEIKGLCKTYYIGGKIPVYALRDVSLSIEPGEFVAIMGPSGSGKSTLLAVLGLLDRPDCGEYRILGKEVSRLTERETSRLRNHLLGFVFQAFNLLPRLDIVTNTMLPFVYDEGITEASRKAAKELLGRVGLGDRLRHRPTELSGGQQQRVALARALANKPLVIMADEPTGNLDTKSAQEIINLFKEINRQGNTIIMVTHEPNLANEASRRITLSDGRIVSDERLRETAGGAVSLPELKPRNFNLFSLSRLANYFNEAFLSLLTNKLRSFLSILGVVIGVGAVIAMLAIGTGAQRQVEQSLSALGTNLLSVRTSFRQGGISLGSDSVPRFNLEDLKALQALDGVKYVIPYVQGRGQAVYGNRNWSTSINGTSVDYQYVRDAVPVQGRFFTQTEEHLRAKVAVLGKQVADQLFPDGNPLGKWIKINRINFQVIGVLPEKGGGGFMNQDDQIFVPLSTAMHRLLGRDYISNFDVQAQSADDLTGLAEEIGPLLVRLHRLPASLSDSYDVRNMADIQKAASETVQTFSFLLGAIAAVSLLVGGIGIMNIMLVMVMERTHEIGLRKALGAEDRDIMTQFLVEAVLICGLGGLIGVGVGGIISFSIGAAAGWSVVITAQSVLLAFVFSVLVGVVFGLWPARRASRLLPIEALRYE
ncbi:MAG: ABC transporter permease [Candidatus Margulisiibacteriota bacterium]